MTANPSPAILGCKLYAGGYLKDSLAINDRRFGHGLIGDKILYYVIQSEWHTIDIPFRIGRGNSHKCYRYVYLTYIHAHGAQYCCDGK